MRTGRALIELCCVHMASLVAQVKPDGFGASDILALIKEAERIYTTWCNQDDEREDFAECASSRLDGALSMSQVCGDDFPVSHQR